MTTLTPREELIVRRIEQMARELAAEVSPDMNIETILATLADEVRPMAVDAVAEQDLMVLQ